MNRDAIDEEAAKKRIDAQMPLALKLDDDATVAQQNDTSKVALQLYRGGRPAPPTKKEHGGGTSCPFPDSSSL